MQMCRRAVWSAAMSLGIAVAPNAAAAQGTSVQPGFRVQMGAAGAPEHAPISLWLERTQILERVARMMNRAFPWPAPIALSTGECGESNVTYERTAEGAAIRVCYELVQAIVTEFQHQDLTTIDRGMAQAGTVMFVLLHEVGHALIDQFRLSVAESEPAADEFAMIILSAGDPMAAFWATEYWRRGGNPAAVDVEADAFSKAHGMDAQRLYSVLCQVYGADPAQRAVLLEGNAFPAERRPGCAAEYRRVASLWERRLAPLFAKAEQVSQR